jgi:hypothetical protein
MDYVLGRRLVEFLGRQTEIGLGSRKIALGHRIANFADYALKSRLGRTVAGAADDILAKTFLSAGGIGHDRVWLAGLGT